MPPNSILLWTLAACTTACVAACDHHDRKLSEGGASSWSASRSGGTSRSITDASFCSGEGSVMFNGFQSTINGACVKLLFQPWVLDSAGKYVVGLIGCFFLSALSEFLNKLRPTAHQQLLSKHEHRVRGKLHLLRCKAPLAVLYVAHMATAFLAMLVVMTYETGLFLALLFGFIAGFVLFRSFDKDVTDEPGVWRFVDPSTTALRISGMSCEKSCGAKVEAALRAVPGVSNAFVQFDTKTAYVAGPAALDDLADAISAAGYGFQHELK